MFNLALKFEDDSFIVINTKANTMQHVEHYSHAFDGTNEKIRDIIGTIAVGERLIFELTGLNYKGGPRTLTTAPLSEIYAHYLN